MLALRPKPGNIRAPITVSWHTVGVEMHRIQRDMINHGRALSAGAVQLVQRRGVGFALVFRDFG